jgi:uncharacterized protein
MRKLRREDLQVLDDFLAGLPGDDAMLLSKLDGYLAGIVVCPDLILPSEWLPSIWGTQGPVFDNERDANEILGLVMARYNDIARELGRKGKYQPILELDTDETHLWEIWSEGFAAAMALRPDSWDVYDTTKDEATWSSFRCLASLAGMVLDGKHLEKDADERVRRGAHRLIADCLEDLNAARLALSSETARPQPTVHVGRNDPCPCGSGKKFKKCCLN